MATVGVKGLISSFCLPYKNCLVSSTSVPAAEPRRWRGSLHARSSAPSAWPRHPPEGSPVSCREGSRYVSETEWTCVVCRRHAEPHRAPCDETRPSSPATDPAQTVWTSAVSKVTHRVLRTSRTLWHTMDWPEVECFRQYINMEDKLTNTDRKVVTNSNVSCLSVQQLFGCRFYFTGTHMTITKKSCCSFYLSILNKTNFTQKKCQIHTVHTLSFNTIFSYQPVYQAGTEGWYWLRAWYRANVKTAVL